MNRRNFLKLLGAAFIAPFVPVTDDVSTWHSTEWSTNICPKNTQFSSVFAPPVCNDSWESWGQPDDYNQWLQEHFPTEHGWHSGTNGQAQQHKYNITPLDGDGPIITMSVLFRAEYSLDDGKVWHNLFDKQAGEQQHDNIQ